MNKTKLQQAVAVIPARWSSSRLAGKPLIKLCGKPLLQWVFERVLQARRISNVVVATDDERIFSACKEFGAAVVMTSPLHPSGTDRVAEAIKNFDEEIVVNVQGDEPTISPLLIDNLIYEMQSDIKWDMATAVTPIRSDEDILRSSVCKVVFAQDGKALYFSRAPIPFKREEKFKIDHPLYFRHIGIYLYRRKFLLKLVETPQCDIEKAEMLEQLRALYIGGNIKIIKTDEMSVGVDTPEDVPRAEEALRKLGIAG
jgi:3-deoxy-manno-octulosonate cytidylyltransferase (CMP-KDO synthetase)